MFGEILGAATSIAGGLLQNKANKEANRQAEAQAQRQYEQQKEFAQSGIQWKVQDAEKAGIHPLYALGANTISYSPQSVGSSATDFGFLGNAGQNIGRAIDATRSNSGKLEALQLTASQLQLEGLALDNDFKRAQLASAAALANQTGSAPGLPNVSTAPSINGMPGQGNAPQIDVTKKVSPHEGIPSIEAVAAPEVAMYSTRSGGYAPQIPQNLSESFEQDWPGFYQWMYRNKMSGDPRFIRAMPTRPGYRKHYAVGSGEYYYKRYPTYGRRAARKVYQPRLAPAFVR